MRLGLFPIGLFALSSIACGQQAVPEAKESIPATQVAPGQPNAVVPRPYVAVATYDTARDPAVDLQSAVAEATRTGKRILVEVGGEWCVWCHIMDTYFDQHPALVDARDRKFLTMKVNFSEENENKGFLSQYPKIPGYPHLFVLESDGTFLHSQGTSELESGRSYDLDRFSAFLKRWERVS